MSDQERPRFGRRYFLKTIAVAGTALTLTPSVFWAEEEQVDEFKPTLLPLDQITPRPGPDTTAEEASSDEPWGKIYSFGNGRLRIINGHNIGVKVLDDELIKLIVSALENPQSKIRSYTLLLAEHVSLDYRLDAQFGCNWPEGCRGKPFYMYRADWQSALDTRAIVNSLDPETVMDTAPTHQFEDKSVGIPFITGRTAAGDGYQIRAIPEIGAQNGEKFSIGPDQRLMILGIAAVTDETMSYQLPEWYKPLSRHTFNKAYVTGEPTALLLTRFGSK